MGSGLIPGSCSMSLARVGAPSGSVQMCERAFSIRFAPRRGVVWSREAADSLNLQQIQFGSEDSFISESRKREAGFVLLMFAVTL